MITAVGAPPAGGGKRPPTYVFEETPWSAFRDAEHPYGFAAFTVDPGTGPGATTRIYVTYYNVTSPDRRRSARWRRSRCTASAPTATTTELVPKDGPARPPARP